MEIISKYLTELMTTLATGNAREHAYRAAFQQLINTLKPELQAVNDPKRSEHGAPDFIFLRGEMTIGYTETKDINVDLDKVEKSEQMQRYFGYSNLILTNYLEFRFFRNGERYGESISIGILSGNAIVPKPENSELLERTIRDFLDAKPEKIKSGVRLAKIMGGKARRIRENVSHYILEKSEKSSELLSVFEVMKKMLVHDLSPENFADMYAQTLVYGLFIARYHDSTQEDFTRQEARDLIPASNPLLQHFFDHIAGTSFDKRLSFIVNELCEIFSVANVKAIMEQYYSRTTLWGETEESPDPVIHFYEDFLKEYDSEQRIKYGAFYTPLPVVRFIVKSIDGVLKNKFNLSGGLADTSKIEIIKTVQGQKRKESIHQAQILDPATGTGTFLNEVIRHIHKSFEGQGGRWASYVDEDLLPRLHGFELMMAPYTIAHLKLGMTLQDMGYEKFSKRLGVYLTNSLEEGYKTENSLFGFGFMQSIAEEAQEASKIKNEKPIMVILGNPPYSISSSNKGEWILNLIKDYKKDLNERKINLDDDYIKFIRFSESLIEKNKQGVMAMITNNSFIDGITHRQMRKHLLETFDEIYILDLHGNAKKKEVAPDGGKDENVFDIQQGVSIFIFVRTSKNKTKLGKVCHSEIFGLRKEKYATLDKNSLETIKWKNLDYKEPYYFFVPKDFGSEKEYERGFSVNDLFSVSSSGVETAKDSLVIDFSKEILEDRYREFNENDERWLISNFKYSLEKIQQIKTDILRGKVTIEATQYRPFDRRHVLYSNLSQGVVWRPRYEVMKHMLRNNTGLIAKRGFSEEKSSVCFITSSMIDRRAWTRPGMQGAEQLFPLYLYHEDGTKTTNFNQEILGKIKSNLSGEVKPEDILDYIYASLHSPSYREKYKEFLKIDFPRVSYPKDNATFWQLVEKGKELRELHLLESPKLRQFVTTFPESGSNAVEKIKYENGKVFINETQYFGNVPEIAWNFFIGGYQPAQKWLKDRKGRTLGNEDLEHYQKIIVALSETDRLMKEIG